MTSPQNATTTDQGRFYTWPPTGEQFPSITTITKQGVPKPHLEKWGHKKCGEFAIGHLDLLAALRERSCGV